MKTLSIIIIAVLIASCSAIENQGAISLSISPSASVMTIGAPISMAAVEYDVSVAAGPSQVAPVSITDTSIVFDRLLPGAYDILVTAMNAAGDVIGSGESPVAVAIGTTTPVTVTVVELSDVLGDLHLDLFWAPPSVVDPAFTIQTMDFAGVGKQMVVSGLDPDAGTAQADATGLTVGWHSVVGILRDNSVIVSGFGDIARIVSGRVTTGSVFTDVNNAEGSLSVLIETDFYSDLDLHSDIPEGDYSIYSTTTETITLSTTDGAILVSWYVNGQAVAVDEMAFTIDGAAFQPGNSYRIDALAWTIDGKKAASMSWQYEVLPEPTAEQLSIEIATGYVSSLYCTLLVFQPDTPTGSNGPTIVEIQGQTDLVISTGPLPFGAYRLLLNIEGVGTDFYYSESQGWTSSPSGSDLVVIPETVDEVLSFQIDE